MVGPGRAGIGLALALRASGVRVAGVHARARRRVPAGVKLSVGAAPPWLGEVHVVLLAVRDDALPRVVKQLAAAKPPRGLVVLHLSGALDTKVLAPLRRLGEATGSLHPLMTVSGDPRETKRRLQGATFAIDGDEPALNAAAGLARALGGVPAYVPGPARGLYHAGAVFASNYLVSMMGAAEVLLMAAGFDDRDARRALAPLARAALERVEQAGPIDALTGPVARGDVETIRKHLAALPGNLRPTYAEVGLVALRLAELQGLKRGTANRVRKALGAAVRLKKTRKPRAAE